MLDIVGSNIVDPVILRASEYHGKYIALLLCCKLFRGRIAAFLKDFIFSLLKEIPNKI